MIEIPYIQLRHSRTTNPRLPPGSRIHSAVNTNPHSYPARSKRTHVTCTPTKRRAHARARCALSIFHHQPLRECHMHTRAFCTRMLVKFAHSCSCALMQTLTHTHTLEKKTREIEKNEGFCRRVLYGDACAHGR